MLINFYIVFDRRSGRLLLARFFCPEDLTQETLIRLVRKVNEGKFDSARGSLSVLGFGIAHYVALEALQWTADEPLEDWQEVLKDV